MSANEKVFRWEEKDGVRTIETDSFVIKEPIVSWEEHLAASKEYKETGCIPLDYAAKVSRGYLCIKAR